MEKRGSMLTFITIITLVVALVVGVAYCSVSKVYATGEITLKTAAARDIALIIDAIYAYSYDTKISYDYDLSKFIVEISRNSVKIYSTSSVALEGNEIKGNDLTLAEYSFTPVNDNPDFILDKPIKIVFTKTDGKLTITGIK